MAKPPEQSPTTAYERGFERGVVTFIDILGYKQLLKTRHADDIAKVVKSLRAFTRGDANDAAPPQRSAEVRLYTQAFSESVSDAVVRVRTIDTQSADGPFTNELIDLMHAIIECVNQGILLRGGMTIGPVYVGLDGKGPIFGEAMVRAYYIEEEEAVYPRIMIDDDALQHFITDKSLWQDGDFDHSEARMVLKFIGIAEDGSHFVDYLRSAGPSEFDDGVGGQFNFLERHRAVIVENLSTGDAKVRRKLIWLANYHNRFIVELRGNYDMSDAAGGFADRFGTSPSTFFDSLMIEDTWTNIFKKLAELAVEPDHGDELPIQ
jgi:hypothetical protein